MRRSLMLSGIAVLIAAMVGCGGDTKPKLWVTAFATTDYDPVRKALYGEFETTHHDVGIKYIPIVATEYYNKLVLQFASNSAPDVVFVENVYFPQFARKGNFIPLTPYIEQDTAFKLPDFHKIGLEMYQFDGRQYCLPGNLAVFVLFYNQDMFDAEDIPYPDDTWDWAKLLEVAQRLTKRDGKGNVTRYGMAYPPHYSIFMLQNEAKVYNEDYSKCIINNPEAREAIQFCAELADKHHVAPTLAQMQSLQADPFQTGQAAMIITGRWQVLPYRKVQGFEWDVAPLPKGKRRATLLGSHGWGISTTCKRPELAWEFIKFITGPAGAKRVVDMGDCNPALATLDGYFVNEATVDWPKERDDNQVYVDSLAYAYTEPLLHPWVPYLQVSTEFGDRIEEYRLGIKTLEEALQNFQDKMNKLIEERRPE
ncbi:MAG: sugar ABC transporter substrate-binding protein [Thermoleophilia bacterium]|nr:sugar ABC transporter substrate-binding protein [Thermoleophilia bacterium]